MYAPTTTNIDGIILISTDNLTCSIPVAYPSYLKLNENTLQNNILNFLDLKLIFKNHKIYTDIYDKRKDFSFSVNCFLISVSVYIFVSTEIVCLIIYLA